MVEEEGVFLWPSLQSLRLEEEQDRLIIDTIATGDITMPRFLTHPHEI